MNGVKRHTKMVPVVIVAGFLGSGKTTLLNHLLRTAAGNRIGVLVNDFGSINIDAMLVAGQVDGTLQLGNGCLCCTVDADGLATTLATLLRPATGIDVVVIEASGIAEPRALVRMVTAIDDDRVAYGGLVYLVDAATNAEVRSEHPDLDQHVSIADLVVINKADLAGDDRIAHVHEWVRRCNPTAAVVVTSDALVDPGMLFDVASRPVDDGPRQLTLDELIVDDGHAGHHDHLHHHFEAVEFSTDDPMDPRRLARVLERPPRGCFRIKGVVHLGGVAPARYVVHSVGGFVRAERGPWGRGESASSSLVAIGSDLDVPAARSALADAVWAPGTVDENGILHVTRYLPGAGAA